MRLITQEIVTALVVCDARPMDSHGALKQTSGDTRRQLEQPMTNFVSAMIAAVAAATLAATPVQAGSCFKKAAEGNALTEGLAKFQVDAALLQAVDWGIYATWVTSNTTPGYSFGPRSYKCAPGDVLGWHCRGSATLCKL